MGEIFVIATDPSTAGTGLGGTHRRGPEPPDRKGLRAGMLYAEAVNTAALRLYERLGFVVHHSNAATAGLPTTAPTAPMDRTSGDGTEKT